MDAPAIAGKAVPEDARPDARAVVVEVVLVVVAKKSVKINFLEFADVSDIANSFYLNTQKR